MKALFRYLFICYFLLIVPTTGYAQSVGYIMPGKAKRIEIPFQFQNGFIVIDVRLQGFFPLKFIYDTGAETTIITNPRIAEILDLKYTRKFQVMGSDMETTLNAYLIKDIAIVFDEGAAPTQDLLVFDRDHFNLEEFIGENVQGILGADLFKNFTVMIDYQAQKLILYKRGRFIPSNKYTAIPMTVAKSKPHIDVQLAITKEKTLTSKLLIDSGAALSVLLDADEDKGLHLPQKTIKGVLGYGIGGVLEGYLGRIDAISIEGYEFTNLITNFRVFNPQIDSLQLNSVDEKDGILGNEILKHFKCVIDYPNNVFYIRPYRKNYNKKVAFDRSGLNLIMVGKQFGQIMVNEVFDNSPAADAGFKKGDLLKAINGISTAFMTYEGITNKFKKSKNKRYRVKVNRQGKILILEFTLRNLI